MASPDKQPVQTDLPPGLRTQFARLQSRLWWVETSAAVFASGIGLLASYLILFFSERFWNTPFVVRLALTLCGALSVGVAGWYWARRWVLRRPNLRSLAGFVQKRHRRLGDRLLGIVELSDEAKRPAQFSPELYAAAIQQVAAEASEFDFEETVSRTLVKRCALAIALLLLIAGAIFVAAPQASSNALLRLFHGKNVQRYTLVALNGLPGKKIVPHGEPFELQGSVLYHSFWKPSQIKYYFKGQPVLETNIQQSSFKMRVPPQVHAGSLQVKLGDARDAVEVVPTHRPVLRELKATITLPEYLKYKPVSQPIQNGTISFVEGSKAAFEGKISRPLAEAEFSLSKEHTSPAQVSGDKFATPVIDAAETASIKFQWRDELGLKSAAPYQLAVQMEKDAPPSPDITGFPREVAMLHTELLELKTVSTDDYGVQTLGLSLRMPATAGEDDEPREIYKIDAEGFDKTKMEETFSFNPTVLKIPPESMVELRAYSIDFFPGREIIESPPTRIYVLGKESHAELVRQKLDALMTRLEEVTRLEEKITAATRELLKKDNLKLEDIQKKSDALAEDQDANAEQLKRMTEEGARMVREASRNPLFNEEVLQDWAKNLQQMDKLASKEMKDASQSLQAAGQSEKNREKQSKSLEKAHQKEEQILDALAEMQKKVNDGMDNLQALTLAQRLRKASDQENEIESKLEKAIPETIGLTPAELPRRFQRLNSLVSDDQSAVQQQAKELRTEISRFFERTQKPKYGEVSKEMTESKTDEALGKITQLIGENISMEAIQNLESWSKRFAGWAEKLEPPKSDDAGGGEGEAGKKEKDVTKSLIALLRLRDDEINVREGTRLVEKQKENTAVYKDSAKGLAATQEAIAGKLAKIQGDLALPAVDPVLNEANENMSQSGSFLNEPRTDKATSDVQTKAVESLTDAINLLNEQAKRPPSSSPQQGQSPSEEEMAFLMQMMKQGAPGQAMKPGEGEGGNMSGGSTDKTAPSLTGANEGRPGETRTVNKSSGAAGANFPAEFRDALETYFKGVEEISGK